MMNVLFLAFDRLTRLCIVFVLPQLSLSVEWIERITDLEKGL